MFIESQPVCAAELVEDVTQKITSLLPIEIFVSYSQVCKQYSTKASSSWHLLNTKVNRIFLLTILADSYFLTPAQYLHAQSGLSTTCSNSKKRRNADNVKERCSGLLKTIIGVECEQNTSVEIFKDLLNLAKIYLNPIVKFFLNSVTDNKGMLDLSAPSRALCTTLGFVERFERCNFSSEEMQDSLQGRALLAKSILTCLLENFNFFTEKTHLHHLCCRYDSEPNQHESYIKTLRPLINVKAIHLAENFSFEELKIVFTTLCNPASKGVLKAFYVYKQKILTSFCIASKSKIKSSNQSRVRSA